MARGWKIKWNITKLVQAAKESGEELQVEGQGTFLVELTCYAFVVNTLLSYVTQTLVHETVPHKAAETAYTSLQLQEKIITHKSDSRGGGKSFRLLLLPMDPCGLEVARGAGLSGNLWDSDSGGRSGDDGRPDAELPSLSDVSSSLARGAEGESGILLVSYDQVASLLLVLLLYWTLECSADHHQKLWCESLLTLWKRYVAVALDCKVEVLGQCCIHHLLAVVIDLDYLPYGLYMEEARPTTSPGSESTPTSNQNTGRTTSKCLARSKGWFRSNITFICMRSLTRSGMPKSG
ncbi:hypothetical protein E2C01_003925 [Portunus trituberculatus]|uniref:Uncharacterized protein n=1 Tax=Portunus trituberculatus TaxID=210409 RepID=A0A5B7CRH7_PORTR|nr:hypothetical protein [Portunus trituberculatus]